MQVLCNTKSTQKLIRIFLILTTLLFGSLSLYGNDDFYIHDPYTQTTNTPTNEWTIFLGRFHPLVVHLPIGFLVFILLLECVAWISKHYFAPMLRVWFVLFSTISCTLSIVIGEFLANGGEYEHDLLHAHETYGKILGVMHLLLLALAWITYKKEKYIKYYRILLACTFFVLCVVGHYGGSLTHGANYLTEYAPFIKKKEKKVFASLHEASVFPDVILPILEKKCLSCHNDQKIKGGLRMDSYEFLMKGGENGPVVIAGSPEKSALLQLALLSRDEKRAMPPEGKTPLSPEEIQIITWWITNGAYHENKVDEIPMDDEIKRLLTRRIMPSATYIPPFYKLHAKQPDESAVKKLREKGLTVLSISKTKPEWLQILFVNAKENIESLVPLLKPLEENITWIDLSNTSITGQSLKKIYEMPHLTKLYIQNNPIKDSDLSGLEKCIHLEVLNLYGTPVTDSCITVLSKLRNLRTLYLWQTYITKKGLEQIKTNLPNTEIINGSSTEDPKDTANTPLSAQPQTGKK